MRESDATFEHLSTVSGAEPERSAAPPRHRLLVEQLPLVTFVEAVSAGGVSIRPSRQAEAMLGYPVEAWLDDPGFFAKILHPDDRDRVLALVDQCKGTGRQFSHEYRLIARNGRVVWVLDERLAFSDEGGTPLFTQGYLLDITARK